MHKAYILICAASMFFARAAGRAHKIANIFNEEPCRRFTDASARCALTLTANRNKKKQQTHTHLSLRCSHMCPALCGVIRAPGDGCARFRPFGVQFESQVRKEAWLNIHMCKGYLHRDVSRLLCLNGVHNDSSNYGIYNIYNIYSLYS